MATKSSRAKSPTRIERKGKEYLVYVGGRYFGVTTDRQTAERIRDDERPNRWAFEAAGELPLWSAWNAAVVSGASVLFEPDPLPEMAGWQFVAFPDFFLGARPVDGTWEVGVWTPGEFEVTFADHRDGTYRLAFATTPYELE
jgi:hypothetical protein